MSNVFLWTKRCSSLLRVWAFVHLYVCVCGGGALVNAGTCIQGVTCVCICVCGHSNLYSLPQDMIQASWISFYEVLFCILSLKLFIKMELKDWIYLKLHVTQFVTQTFMNILNICTMNKISFFIYFSNFGLNEGHIQTVKRGLWWLDGKSLRWCNTFKV